MAEPELAVIADRAPGDALRPQEGPVGAALVLQDPGILLTLIKPEHRVLPGDP
jgi:hypothetical protein